ncbi:CapA family protein [Pseudorhodoferax sp.]|uniref:CapA family protein n=1 Tax=Pseudorhodoferax sp. TaxID=1993553 RepID=UPI0039E67E23
MAARLAFALGAAFALPGAGAGAQDGAPAPVSLAIVGDVMLAGGPGRAIARGHDPLGPFGAILAAADVRVANLECVVASTGRAEADKPWTFRAHPRSVAVLKRHLDAVSLANNHSGDYGPRAFGQMLGLLGRAGIGVFGGGHDLAEAHAPLIVERKGLRIALLGYDEFFPRSFEADTDKPGVAWSEDEQVRRDIAAARTVHRADLVIPFMHWGIEHAPLADARQRTLARLMIDAGADAVIGSHPHVTQDVETYRGKPIVYSLGNFVFDGFSDADNNTGWLLRLELDRDGVRSWNTVIARIDGRGIPHPRPDRPAPCWERGAPQAHMCRAAAFSGKRPRHS